MRRDRWFLPLLAVLGGCMHLGVRSPQVRQYRIDYTPPTLSVTPLPVTVEVGLFSVAAAYDREAIVYRESTYSTGAYFDARWSANPGNLVADLLARDLAASGLFRAVQRVPAMVPSDYQVGGEIQEIEERATGTGCAAHLQLQVLLVRSRAAKGRSVLLQRTYTGDEAAPCNAPEQLVAAMSRALAGISAQFERDVYGAIAADAASSS
jgi:ABC-type uncharacterized transport system auxiliary subunit